MTSQPPYPQPSGQGPHAAGGPYPGQPYGSQHGVPVGFGDAVKRCYATFARFTGRASRSEYWWVVLYLFLINLVGARFDA